MKHNISNIGLVLRGMAMGIAEVIPGVSGGTIAFISGIYEDLIDTIKSFGPKAIEAYKSNGIRGLWSAINGSFLVFLLGGMLLGLVSGIFGVTYLMETYPEPLWAFFFGLILASAIYLAKQIKSWNVSSIIGIVAGALFAYMITTLAPAQGSLHLGYVFFSGMIAISALMLPGISGSFILLIMGMYGLMIPMVKDLLKTMDFSNIVPIGVFALGCLTGLAGFSRVLSYLFNNYRQTTFAVLTGFLIGALNKVWPWRNITAVYDKVKNTIVEIPNSESLALINLEEAKILTERNVFPSEYWGQQPMVVACVVSLVMGIALVLLLERSSSK